MPGGRILTPRSGSEPCGDARLDPLPPSPSCRRGPDSVSLFHLQRSQASHPLLPPQPLVLQLAEHLLLQPQPQPQLRQLQHQPQPQPDSQPPQPLPQPPQPQPQLQQPQQLGECRLLSPPAPPSTRPQPPTISAVRPQHPMPPAPPGGRGAPGRWKRVGGC